MSTATFAITTLDARPILEFQHESGAYPASPGFSQYPHSWLRDGAFIAHSMDLSGHFDSARAFHRWVVRTLTPHLAHIEDLVARHPAHPDPAAMLPARFSVTGAWLRDDGWPNFQLDGYGQWLWSLERHLHLTGESGLPEGFEPVVRAVARYLAAFYAVPCSDCWEEKPDQVHTATLASIHGGLRAISKLLPEFAASAEWVRAHILEHCVADGRFVKSSGHSGVDSSLLWLATPFNVVSAQDPRMQATVNEIERLLVRDGGLIRYAEDEYYGAGAWLLLTDFLAWHLAERGDLERARGYHAWVERQRRASGDLPEQVPVSSTDGAQLEAWTARWGTSASPLLWSHAMHLIAARALRANFTVKTG